MLTYNYTCDKMYLYLRIKWRIKMNRRDFTDVSIHGKDWKNFKKTATQEELIVLGIGSKFRLNSTLWTSLIWAVGIIVSVIVGIVLINTDDDPITGLIILIVGYLLFSFLSTKRLRYTDTYSEICGELNKENKKKINSILKPSFIKSFISVIINIILGLITIPYQFVMVIIGWIAPKFVISKNGVLITIPKGYGFENLAAIGEYYARQSLIDEMLDNSYKKNHKYEIEIIDDYGNTVKLHSADNIHFSDGSDGCYISDDGGRTVKKD